MLSAPEGHLLQFGIQLFNKLSKLAVVGIDFQRTAKFVEGFLNHAFGQINPAEIDEWEVAWFVTSGRFGLLEPRDSVVKALLLHQIHTDVVIGIAKFGVELDGDLALGNGFVEPADETIGPTQISMRIGGGEERDRFFVKTDRVLELLRHLVSHRLFDELKRPFLVSVSCHWVCPLSE